MARLAKLPEYVIERAQQKSEEFETAVEEAKRAHSLRHTKTTTSGGVDGKHTVDDQAAAILSGAANIASLGEADVEAAIAELVKLAQSTFAV